MVYAEDDNRHGLQPKGKQSSLFHSHGCDYTRTTGIWQTVWLEFVPKTYLKSVKTQSDYRNRTVTFTAAMAGQEADATLRACISFEGCVQKEVEVALNTGKTTFTDVYKRQSYDNARSKITHINRDEIVEELVKAFVEHYQLDKKEDPRP